GLSYLSYPRFDREAHPALAWSYHVDLRGLIARFDDYSERNNPPVLHRKELFVNEGFPRRSLFAKLTRQEEKLGLLADGAAIGTREGWEETLAKHNLRISGHRVLKCSETPSRPT